MAGGIGFASKKKKEPGLQDVFPLVSVLLVALLTQRVVSAAVRLDIWDSHSFRGGGDLYVTKRGGANTLGGAGVARTGLVLHPPPPRAIHCGG